MKKALCLILAAAFSTEAIAGGLIDSAAAVQAAQAACKAISPPYDARVAASIAQAALTRLPAPDGPAAGVEWVHACAAAGTTAAAGIQAAEMAAENAAASAAILAALAAVAVVEHEKK